MYWMCELKSYSFCDDECTVVIHFFSVASIPSFSFLGIIESFYFFRKLIVLAELRLIIF